MSPTVLIGDSQIAVAQAMSGLLSRYNIDAEICKDGFEALQRYAEKSYDCLVLEVELPRVSGIEVTRKIRAAPQGNSASIILTTSSYKGEKYRNKAKESLGVHHYLEKPFSKERFLDTMKSVLNLTSGEPMDKNLPAAAPGKRRPESRERKPAGPPPLASGTRAPSQAAGGTTAIAGIKPRSALQGDLSTHPVSRILLEARRKRITGIFYISRDGEDRTVVFLNGLPVSQRTSNADTSFGNHLFNQGKISLMEYQVYQGQYESSREPDDIVIKMGAIHPRDYLYEWARYLEESLIQLSGWEDGTFTFQLWPTLPEGTPTPQTNVAHIIHQAYKLHQSDQKAREDMEKIINRYPVLTTSFYDYQMHLFVEPFESIFFDRIDGEHKLSDLFPEDETERQKLARAMGAYTSLGMIEMRDRPAPMQPEAPFPVRDRSAEERQELLETGPEEEIEEVEAPTAEEPPAEEGFDDLIDDLEDTLSDVVEQDRPDQKQETEEAAREKEEEKKRLEEELVGFYEEARQKNYYEILGMKMHEFSFSRMKDEYFKLTRKFSPENFIESSGDVLAKAEEALSILATAYNTLSNVISKEKYDEMLATKKGAAGVPGAKDHDRMQAEVAFQSGMAFMEMSDWEGAEKSLGQAMSLQPDQPEIMAHYAYALYNKNRKSKTVQQRVEQILHQALRIKPKCAPALAYRGVLLLDDDKVSLAEADFKKALSINPRYKAALKGMRAVENRRQQDKKGLFGRFKK
ncbi:MAG: response regulator [bacterium]